MTDCICPKPDHDGRGYCARCKGFACEYAGPGRTRCPSSICDCFIETHPDSPRDLHPEAFAVWTGTEWFIPLPIDKRRQG